MSGHHALGTVRQKVLDCSLRASSKSDEGKRFYVTSYPGAVSRQNLGLWQMHWKNSTINQNVHHELCASSRLDITLNSAFYWNLGYFSGLNALTKQRKCRLCQRYSELCSLQGPCSGLSGSDGRAGPSWFYSELCTGTFQVYDYIRHFETDKEKAGPFSRPGKIGFKFRNKDCAIFRTWEQRTFFLYSTALSLLSKVYNSNYSKLWHKNSNLQKCNLLNKVKTLFCDTLQKYFLPFIVR